VNTLVGGVLDTVVFNVKTRSWSAPLVVTQENPRTREKKNEKGSALTSVVQKVSSGPAYRASLFHGALGLKRWTKSIPIVNTLDAREPAHSGEEERKGLRSHLR
jgi:hypothetical protein